MEGQAPPPVNGVAPDPLTAADEPHPPTRAAEDVLPTGTDDLAPALDAVVLEPAAVTEDLPVDAMEEDVLSVTSDELHPPTTRAADDVLPSGADIQAPPLDAVMTSAVTEELPVDAVEEDVLSVTVDASSEVSEDGTNRLTDELRDQIVKQVEYYFSDENLPTDVFLLKFVKKNRQGFVPIGVIASFRRMKKLVQDHATIATALRTSSKLVVTPDGKWIRRLRPALPHAKLKDAKKRTVIVENLPPNFSKESLQEQFGTIGKVVGVTINDPSSVKESSKPKNAEFTLRKVHALVEYEAVEAAEKAVSTLNDERDWRTGLKVSLMTKRIVPSSGKFNQFSKENQDLASIWIDLMNQPAKKEQNTTSEKNSTPDPAEGSTNEKILTVEDELQQQKPNAKGGRKGRYRGQGKGQIQQNDEGQGDSGFEPSNKPIPGPKMPDGTRGFTMGRGRPLPLQNSEKIEE